jgi:hypothetical protein
MDLYRSMFFVRTLDHQYSRLCPRRMSDLQRPLAHSKLVPQSCTGHYLTIK